MRPDAEARRGSPQQRQDGSAGDAEGAQRGGAPLPTASSTRDRSADAHGHGAEGQECPPVLGEEEDSPLNDGLHRSTAEVEVHVSKTDRTSASGKRAQRARHSVAQTTEQPTYLLTHQRKETKITEQDGRATPNARQACVGRHTLGSRGGVCCRSTNLHGAGNTSSECVSSTRGPHNAQPMSRTGADGRESGRQEGAAAA